MISSCMHALNHKHSGEMHSIKKVLKPHFLRSIVPVTHERAIQFMPSELLVEFKGGQTYVGNHMAHSQVSPCVPLFVEVTLIMTIQLPMTHHLTGTSIDVTRT